MVRILNKLLSTGKVCIKFESSNILLDDPDSSRCKQAVNKFLSLNSYDLWVSFHMKRFGRSGFSDLDMEYLFLTTYELSPHQTT